MTKLKQLAAAVFLTCAFALPALADCAQPAPGQTEGPPCVPAMQVVPDDPTVPGTTSTPLVTSLSEEVDFVSIAEIALNALLLF